MKKFALTLIFLNLFLVIGFIFDKPAEAFAYTISGSIKDNDGNAIQGASVDIYNAGSSTSIATVTSDSVGVYNVDVAQGTYDIKVTPPLTSNFGPASAKNYLIASNKTINFILVAGGNVTLSGHFYGLDGAPIANQLIRIFKFPGSSDDVIGATTTDASGAYSLQVESGLSRILQITGLGNNQALGMPLNYQLNANPFRLEESTVLDITIPVKRVTVHVQDKSGNAVSGATINTEGGGGNLAIGGTVTNAGGGGSSSGQTDAAGNAVLWMLPGSHTITATPPSGNSNITTTLSNVSISADTTVTLTLIPAPVILSGHMYDADGNPVPNQQIRIFKFPGSSDDVIGATTTDASGAYSLQVAPGLSRILQITGIGNNPSLKTPQNYQLNANPFTLEESTVLNITIPIKRVTVHVQDTFGNPIEGSGVMTEGGGGNLAIGGTVTNAGGGGSSSGQTNASGNAVLWMLPGTHTINVSPPSGSNASTAIVPNVSINEDKTVTVTLVAPVTLSGQVRSALGAPIPNQRIRIFKFPGSNNDVIGETITNASGAYSLQISAGNNHILQITGLGNNQALGMPLNYQLNANPFSIQQNTVLDIALPTKEVTIHVQDKSGNAVSGATINTEGGGGNLAIGGTVTNAGGGGSSSGQTDAAGNAVLWMLPGSHTITVSPPINSNLTQATLSNISISEDQTEVISLQYNHNAPATTIGLTTQHADGRYSNPTIVTLTATADSGYTIANIFYKIDGGAQQTYSGPFEVTGNGEHTIEYWSVDSSGVPEAHKTKVFTIYVNKAPIIEPISGAAINEGGTYAVAGSFSDVDSVSWTATVDYGEGAGPEPLTLNPDETFNLNHQYDTPGEYTVAVVVRDDQQATGTTNATVTVNGAPQIAAIDDTSVNLQDSFFKQGSFTDADSTSWTATVSYGDGSGVQPLQLDGKNFVLDYTYQTAGNYEVTVTVTDNQGAQATETFTVSVNAAAIINDFPGGTLVEGGTYTHTGFFSDPGSTSWTGTVNYGDGAGDEPLVINPDNTFALSHLYKDNGFYSIIVSITDNQGAGAIQTAFLTVTNEVPNVGTITASINPIQVNTSTSISAPFTDAGVLDTHTVVIDWGDGQQTQCTPNTSGCTISETNGSGTVSGSHVYTTADVYEIKFTVTDKDNGEDEEYYRYLAVYLLTNQSHFSGASKFTSPAGAVSANPTLSGAVKFGIIARYQNSSPDGSVSMKFDAANIEFESTDINVLVVSTNNATGVGTVKGKGTINGAGNYDFLVKGSDGGNGAGNDFVRFKITNPSNNNAVVYDSQPGASEVTPPTSAVTGQVIIHN